MIAGLLQTRSLILYLSCRTVDGEDEKAPVTASTPPPVSQALAWISCTLEITVYGRAEQFDGMRRWINTYDDVYLQDPVECHLDVPYRNPHKLSSSDLSLCPYVSQIVSGLDRPPLHIAEERPRLLAFFEARAGFIPETPQPALIRTRLARHQKQALTFMIRREKGWRFNPGRNTADRDIWAITRTEGRGYQYINTVSGAQQAAEPPPFHGGIIADAFGLGKTLTMIALVANDFHGSMSMESMEFDPEISDEEDELPGISATLVVVPHSALDTWEGQISEHAMTGALECSRHVGKDRLVDVKQLHGISIVLTTYRTVLEDCKPAENSILFTTRWKRIILDEAHAILDINSELARAVCRLDSISRWAVTGTPIQNTCSDLASLIRFLRAYPYDNAKLFDSDISHQWEMGRAGTARERLALLSGPLMLRRSRTETELPPQRHYLCDVRFSEDERRAYEQVRQRTIAYLDKVLEQSVGEAETTGAYVIILEQIETLRIMCNLGVYYRPRRDEILQPAIESRDWRRDAQGLFDTQREMGPVVCSRCSAVLGEAGDDSNGAAGGDKTARLSRCFGYVCVGLAPVSVDNGARDAACDSSTDDGSGGLTLNLGLPSKIKALVYLLKTLRGNVKCVVYSAWRLVLDGVEAALEQASLRSVRFDSRVPPRERREATDKFRDEPEIRVMLLSLTCGAAAGPALTAASHVFIMEPSWNPTVEERALAWIHRMGRSSMLVAVRFKMHESLEQHVTEVQRLKDETSCLFVFNQVGPDGQGGIKSRLRELRSMLE
ncbi:hypothetical protein CDD83_5545 [Cordyceps sp. RAO-2017]|nr:hypothetical protein CDD83_5545 [Cordyceps sp. RAO-2017]